MKYIKVYDINYKVLDELYEYNTLIHSFVLNAMGKCSFNVPLESPKCTQINFQPFNIVEIYDNSNILWWGVISSAIPDGSILTVQCFDYSYLFQKTIAVASTVANQTADQILTAEVGFFNTASNRVVSPQRYIELGHTDAMLAFTATTFTEEDYYKRITGICSSFNYDYDIDSNFYFNYYLRKGTDKPYYSINFGTDADNVTGTPTYTQDTSTMANAIYYNGIVMAQDLVSQSIYGKISVETAVTIATGESAIDIQNAINAELQTTSYPSISIQVDILDSDLCPFNAVNIGDKITVNFPTYWGFNQLMKIIEMDFDDMTGKCTVTLGNIIYRQQPPQKKLYMR